MDFCRSRRYFSSPSTFCLSTLLMVLLHRPDCASAQTQFGTRFIVAMPYGQADGSGSDSISDLYLGLTNPNSQGITVEVRMVGAPLTIPIGGMKTEWHLTGSAADWMQPNNGISYNRTLEVKTNDGSLFSLLVTGTKAYDGYLAIPVDHWGKDHTVATYCHGVGAVCQLVILASTSPTTVTLTIPAEKHTFSADNVTKTSFRPSETLTETLNEYGAWVVNRPFEMTGAVVSSTNPVGVLAGAQWTVYKGSMGAVNEQIPPVTSLGKEFVTIGTATARFVTTEADTTLYCSDHPSVRLARRHQWTQSSYTDPVYFRTNRPVLVALMKQEVKTAGDPSYPVFSLMTPVPQFMNSTDHAPFPVSFPPGQADLILVTREKSRQYVSVTGMTPTSVSGTDYSLNVYENLNSVTNIKMNAGASHSDVLGLYIRGKSADTAFLAPLAARYDVINPACIPSTAMEPGDGVDNDCDGEVDEDDCPGGSDCKWPADSTRDGWGKKFVVVLPPFLQGRDAQLGITTTYDSSSFNVDVDQPSNGTTRQSLTLGGNIDSKLYNLTTDEWNVLAGDLSNRVVRVCSEQDISIICYASYSSQAGSMRLIPLHSLGREYRVVTVCDTSQVCSFQVVGIYSDTDINIHLLLDAPGCSLHFQDLDYVNGDVIRTCISEHQAMELSSSNCSMTGSLVSASRPVAVFSMNTANLAKYDAPKYDYFMEQLPPAESYGKRFILKQEPVRLNHTKCSTKNCHDYVYIVASEADTEVQITNSSTTVNFTLQYAGQVEERRIDVIEITSNEPILVVHLILPIDYKASMGALAVVTPVSQFADFDILAFPDRYPRFSENPLHELVVVQSEFSPITVDGQSYSPTEQGAGSQINITYQLVNYTLHSNNFSEVSSPSGFGGYICHYLRTKGCMMTSLAHLLKRVNEVRALTLSAPDAESDSIHDEHSGDIQTEDKTKVGGSDGGMPRKDFNPSASFFFRRGLMLLLVPVSKRCTVTKSEYDDGVDNDCDGLTDEEPCNNTVESEEATSTIQASVTASSSDVIASTVVSDTASLTTLWTCVDDATVAFATTPMSTSTPILTTSWSCVPDGPSTATLSPSPSLDWSSGQDLSTSWSCLDDSTESLTLSEATVTVSEQSSMSEAFSAFSSSSTAGFTSISPSLDSLSTVASPVVQSASSVVSTSSSVDSSSSLAYSGFLSLTHVGSSQLSASLSLDSTPAVTSLITPPLSSYSASDLLPASPAFASSLLASSACLPPNVLINGTCFPSSVTTEPPTSTTTTTAKSPSNLCACNCRRWQPTTVMDSASLTSVLNSIVDELSVKKSELSSVRRKKISAEDNRPSAQTVGYFGVAIICGIAVGIVVLDAGALYRDVKNLIHACKRS